MNREDPSRPGREPQASKAEPAGGGTAWPAPGAAESPPRADGPRSLPSIAWEGLRRAPRRHRISLLLNGALAVVIGAYDIVDNINRSVPHPISRAVSLTMIWSGSLILTAATILWTMSQQIEACDPFLVKVRRLRTRRLDEMLIAFPGLGFIAGCLVAGGLALFVPVARNWWSSGVVIGVSAAFFLWTGSMIVSTTRFLYSHAREQAKAAERARREAAESQLAALQAQMNPHFLFNALNTVASLVRTDAAAAEAMVENLAVVLRRTLDRSQRVLSTVDDEIDYLAAYLSVAQQRFEKRLHVHWSVDPAAGELLAPTMTLQPLVENALKHGIGARLDGGALHIGVHVEHRAGVGAATDGGGSGAGRSSGPAPTGDERVLVIEVADDGPGFPRRYREATGLSNLRERLTTLFGGRASLEIDRSGPGSRVVITVPASRDAADVFGTVLSAGADNAEGTEGFPEPHTSSTGREE